MMITATKWGCNIEMVYKLARVKHRDCLVPVVSGESFAVTTVSDEEKVSFVAVFSVYSQSLWKVWKFRVFLGEI